MSEVKKIKFYLASASPRRKELIGHLSIPFEIQTADIDEKSHHLSPDLFASDIAYQKGIAIVNKLEKSHSLTVSADTVVSLNGKIFGKPKNEVEAREYLEALSDKEHSVFTAVWIFYNSGSEILTHGFVQETKVTFNKISTELMDLYISTKDSLDKAGAYGIQGPSLTFISKVNGDYANVVGFPLSRFVDEVQDFFSNKLNKRDMWLKYF